MSTGKLAHHSFLSVLYISSFIEIFNCGVWEARKCWINSTQVRRLSCFSTFITVSYLCPRHYLSKIDHKQHYLIFISLLSYISSLLRAVNSEHFKAGRGWVFFPVHLYLRVGRREGQRKREITFNSSIYHNIIWKFGKTFIKNVCSQNNLINCYFFLHWIIRPEKKDNGEHHQVHETLDQDSVRICKYKRTCSKEGQDYQELLRERFTYSPRQKSLVKANALKPSLTSGGCDHSSCWDPVWSSIQRVQHISSQTEHEGGNQPGGLVSSELD